MTAEPRLALDSIGFSIVDEYELRWATGGSRRATEPEVRLWQWVTWGRDEIDTERTKRQQAEHERDCAVQDVAKLAGALQMIAEGVCPALVPPMTAEQIARAALDVPAEPTLEAFDMRASFDAAKGLEASATFRGDAVKEWCVIAVDWFREVGGKSFVSMDMTDPRDGEHYTMTVQRAGGKTPAQEIAELKAQLHESSLTRG